MNEYLFDVKVFASIRVKGTTEQEARVTLSHMLDCATVNAGAFPDGTPMIFEASLDDDHPDLVEVNGEPA